MTLTTNNVFTEQVHRYFDPIATRFGMQCEVETDNRVRFQNETAFMEICFDSRRSREVSVNVGRIPISFDSSFDLTDVLRRYGYSDLKRVGELRGDGADRLTAAVNLLSSLTLKYASSILSGSDSEVLAVRAFRNWASLKYAWETAKPASVIAAIKKLRTSPFYDEVVRTLDSHEREILRQAQLLNETEGTP